MNVVDICIVLLLIGLGWLGYHNRPVRQASISLGAVAGLLLGAAIYKKLAFLAANSSSRTLVLGLLVLALGFLCYDVLMTVGAKLDKKIEKKFHHKKRLHMAERGFSVLVSLASGGLLLWLVIGAVSALPFPSVQQQIGSSQLVLYTKNNLKVPDLVNDAARLLFPLGSPTTFVGTEPTFNSVEVSQDYAALDKAVSNAAPSVYKVTTWGCSLSNQGSGFVASPQAIVTNAHVVAGAKRISVQDSTTSYTAQVIWFDPLIDLAVLSTSVRLPDPPLRLNTLDNKPGTIAAVMGYPQNGGLTSVDAVILQRLSARGYDIYDQKTVSRTFYALRSNVVPGNSGGPLVGTNGGVMGLVFGHSTVQERTGYALTVGQISDGVKAALQQQSQTAVPNGTCID